MSPDLFRSFRNFWTNFHLQARLAFNVLYLLPCRFAERVDKLSRGVIRSGTGEPFAVVLVRVE